MRLRLFVVLVAVALAAKEKPKAVKNPTWPPKAGIKTPGIQVPFANLKAEAELAIGGTPAGMLVDGMTVMVPVKETGAVARFASRDNKAQDAWKGIEEPCGGIVKGFDSVWVPDCKKQGVARLAGKDGKFSAKAEVGVSKARVAIAANGDSVWVLSDDKGTLSRLDPADNHIVSELRVGPSCNSILSEQDALWLTCGAENKLVKVDPKTNVVEKRIDTALDPVAVVFGDAHLWVLGNKEGKVSKIDPKTMKVVATIETGVADGKGTIAFGDGFVWVSQMGYPLTKIDAKTDKVAQQFGGSVWFGSGSVWIADAAKKTLARFDPKRIALTLPD
jgi:virginiamycin B lyase